MTVPIDLRSDTVTRPTPEMRRAMAEAEVGDDVFGEDPTVRRLEELSAERLGTEAALFVPTGTMGNQIALAIGGRPGTEVIVEARGHVYNYEMGAMSALSGLLPRVVPTADGILRPADVEAAVQPDVPYRPRTSAVVVENTHNMAGGRLVPVDVARAVVEVARRHRLHAHLDGARIWNAAVALGVPAAELAAGFDSVMFCVSKGLGAPVGSLLCGRRDFVSEARRVRKRFGGGMRQVGVLAAAGIVALGTMVERLAEDHAAARRLGREVGEAGGVLEAEPETNIVIWRAPGATASSLVEALERRSVRCVPVDGERVRMVTHFDLPAGWENRTAAAIREAIGELSSG